MKTSYPTPGVVSVWIGNFAAEADFEKCVCGPVAIALGLSAPLSSVSEVAFEVRAVPVRDLIKGFSGWESFLDYAVLSAAKEGLDTANAALVCYNVRCHDAPEALEKLYFLGNFPGQDVR